MSNLPQIRERGRPGANQRPLHPRAEHRERQSLPDLVVVVRPPHRLRRRRVEGSGSGADDASSIIKTLSLELIFCLPDHSFILF